MSERAIFIAALTRPKGSARAAFLEEACGPNVELRRQIDVLLDEHEHLGEFLDHPAPGLPSRSQAVDFGQPGMLIGAYRLLEQIGEGGMGLVFMAEQTRPVRRKVALKIV